MSAACLPPRPASGRGGQGGGFRVQEPGCGGIPYAAVRFRRLGSALDPSLVIGAEVATDDMNRTSAPGTSVTMSVEAPDKRREQVVIQSICGCSFGALDGPLP